MKLVHVATQPGQNSTGFFCEKRYDAEAGQWLWWCAICGHFVGEDDKHKFDKERRAPSIPFRVINDPTTTYS